MTALVAVKVAWSVVATLELSDAFWMRKSDIEPLETHLWFSEVEKLQARRSSADGVAPDALFRKAFYLVQLAPRPLRDVVPDRVDEATIEAFLDCGAFVSAAIALFSFPTSITLAREEASELIKATVRLAGSAHPGEDVDKEPAKALLGAWCHAVLALRPSEGEMTVNPRGQRRWLSGQGPQTTKH